MVHDKLFPMLSIMYPACKLYCPILELFRLYNVLLRKGIDIFICICNHIYQHVSFVHRSVTSRNPFLAPVSASRSVDCLPLHGVICHLQLPVCLFVGGIAGRSVRPPGANGSDPAARRHRHRHRSCLCPLHRSCVSVDEARGSAASFVAQ